MIGMACRFGGGISSPEDMWEVLSKEADVVTDLPTDRGWDIARIYDPDPHNSGTTYTRSGAFLTGVADFDADFFGISPKEAAAMDPQQRLVLEIAWELAENSGIAPHALRKSDTGVFVGTNEKDYLSHFFQVPTDSEGFLVSGNAPSVVSGRISHFLGLHGPSLTVDTACSSSLMAIHLACRSLREAECDLAIAGGVAVMSSPGAFIDFSRKQVNARDGRVKAYSDDADGTGWGEGAGLLLLERLGQARRRGHRILGVIRGTAANQDGASSGVAAVPYGPAQERVIEQALLDAGIRSDQIDAVDGHGTGTAVGDVIEVRALINSYGRDRAPDRPLWLGSVKSNIGHTQAAAGVAGVIKMIKAMEHGRLPATLNIGTPNSRVDWDDSAVRLLDRPRPWEANGEPRRAGVSAFGLSGTNVHVIVEEAPGAPEPRSESTGADLPWTAWVLSARSDRALREQAARLRTWLATSTDTMADIGAALVHSRAPFKHRAVVVADCRDSFAESLSAIERGEPGGDVSTGVARPGLGRPVLVFSGQGAHWAGMGADLLEVSPVFAETLRAADAALAPFLSCSVLDVLRQEPGAPTLDDPAVQWPASYAVTVALAAMWRAHGVEPGAVIGHSQGEIAAAVVAGALTLEEGARIIVARTRVRTKMRGIGTMLVTELPVAEVQRRIEPYRSTVSVAVVNGPAQVVVSGATAEVTAIQEQLRSENIRAFVVRGADGAGHSPKLDEFRDEFAADIAGIVPRAPAIPFFSTVTGNLLDAEPDVDYWFDNGRQPVRFDLATLSAIGAGHQVFIECSAHPLLLGAIEDLAAEAGVPVKTAMTLRRDTDGVQQFLRSAADLHCAGIGVDWASLFPRERHRSVRLPNYPFQRQRFWLEPADADTPVGGRTAEHEAFWQAVEQGDAATFAQTLGLTGAGELAALAEVLPSLSDWHRRDTVTSTIEANRYGVVWEPSAQPPPLRGRAGSWLVLVPAARARDQVTEQVLEAVRARAEDVRVLAVAPHDDRSSLTARLRDESTGGAAFTGVVSLLALDESPSPATDSVPTGTAHNLALAQALGDAGIDAPLTLLTQGAVRTGDSDRLEHPIQEQTWALGRVVALEHPERWGNLIDLPARPDAVVVRNLAAMLTEHVEDQIALRGNGHLVRRLAPGNKLRRDRTAIEQRWQPGPADTVLVTGGTGGLARPVTKWLAERGAGRLILASRRGQEAEGIAEHVAELTALGAEVTVVACDVRDRRAVRAVLDGEHAITAVFHLAGVGRLQSISESTAADFAEVFGAKAAGARVIHELTEELDIRLAAFVLFSSVSVLWGAGRQAPYGASGAYLHALAEHRRGRGLSATAIAWTAWNCPGMGMRDAAQEALRRQGLPDGAFDQLGMTEAQAAMQVARHWGFAVFEPEFQLHVLEDALASAEPVTVVADVEWERFTAGYASARRRPLLSGIPEALRVMDELEGIGAGGQSPGQSEGAHAWKDRLRQAPPGERASISLDLVCSEIAAVLGYDATQIDPDRPFIEMGMDSIVAVQLRNQLGRATDLRLPGSIAFTRPTPRALAEHILSATLVNTGIAEDAAPPAPDAEVTEPVASEADSSDSLVRLYLGACEQGRAVDAARMVQFAGRLRPAFTAPDVPPRLPRPVQLAEGAEHPVLVCTTPYAAPSGPHQYVRFVAPFRGDRQVWAIPNPGFAKDELLAADLPTLFETQARAVLDVVGDAPFVLTGYSSGGWVAYGTAAHLESLGRSPAGVIMLDSFSLRHHDDARIFATMINQLRSLEGLVDVPSEELTAMGHYGPLFEHWAASPLPELSIPVLLVRAEEQPMLDPETGEFAPPPDEVTVTRMTPGNHYTMMTDHALRASAVVREWLAETFPAEPR
ncbi:SDR family NAD(P)-dependent oxidoreductase [Nocardia takedensis]